MQLAIRVLLALFVVLSYQATALACGCFANPPCSAFWSADLVFIGQHLRDAEIVKERLSEGTVSTFAVERVLRGDAGGDAIAIRQNHSSCEYRFEVGKRYLVYAYRKEDGSLTTGTCSRTRLLDGAEQEIATLQSLLTLAPYGRVYGKVDRVTGGRLDTTETKIEPAVDITVALISGNSRFETTTDSEGEFEITTVPPGKYDVQAVVPDTIKVYQERQQIEVAARGCAPVHFSVLPNGRVTGRLFLADGTPIAKASVSLRQEEIVDAQERHNAPAYTGYSDESGRFVVDGVPPGRYYLGVNLDFGPSRDHPYLATYYPGVTDRRQGQVIELGEGELKSGYDIPLAVLRETTISGILVDSSETPIVGMTILTAPVEHPFYSSSTKTDASGRFTLNVLSGQTYVIRALVPPPTAEASATVTATDEPQQVRLVLLPKK